MYLTIITNIVPNIYCDNISTVSLSHNSILQALTKHVELNVFFLRKRVLNNILKVMYIPSDQQYVDVLTKSHASSL